MEVTAAPTMKSNAGALRDPTVSGSPTVLPPGVTAGDGRSTIFTNNVRLQIPTTSRRVIPYVVGGGGIANVTESFTFRSLTPVLPLGGVSIPTILRPRVSRSSTDLALTLGGGASLLAGDHLSIDADLRYFRLIGDRDLNAG